MQEREADIYSQECLRQAPLGQLKEGNRRFDRNLLWWRSPPAGYIACILLMGAALLVSYVEQFSAAKMHISNALFSLVTIVVALLWGVGPALFAIVLGFITLGIFVISPSGLSTSDILGDMIMYGPWLLGELIVIMIVAQREKAQQRAFVAELEMYEREKQLKDIFLSRVSHELKTPITTIQAQAQLILRRLVRSESTTPELLLLHNNLERIARQTGRLHALINDLLDASSLSSGKVSLRLTQCNLGSLCSEVVEDQRALSGRHIELELPSDPMMLQADYLRLSQVVINLVSNAVKYSPEDTVIRVCVSQKDPHVILTVHNDGSAILQEHLMHIFEPFYRAPQAQYSSSQGWGLGLSISKEIVEQHGGQIWVESYEREGTIFFVQLPLANHLPSPV